MEKEEKKYPFRDFYIFRVVKDFIHGAFTFRRKEPLIAIYGSARSDTKHYSYLAAYNIAYHFAQYDYSVISGGGPGVMEAASRGAIDGGKRAYGVNIQLPHEQFPNKYLTEYYTSNFFSVRKTFLIEYAVAYIILPGGFGTMDEFFEILTLMQTGKIKRMPIVLLNPMGYYDDLVSMMHKMREEAFVSEDDCSLIYITSSENDVLDYVLNFYHSNKNTSTT